MSTADAKIFRDRNVWNDKSYIIPRDIFSEGNSCGSMGKFQHVGRKYVIMCMIKNERIIINKTSYKN